MLAGKRSLIILLCLCLYGLKAQNVNPFELQRPAGNNTPDSAKITKDSSALQINPFELRPAAVKTNFAVEPDYFKVVFNHWMSVRQDPTEIRSILFWLLLFLTFMMSIALNLNRNFLIKLYRSNVNLNFMNLLYRESKEENRLIFPILYGLYFAGMSIFIYLGLILWKGSLHPLILLYISLGVSGIYLIRHLSLRALGWVFGVVKETDRYLFNIVSYGSMLSVLLIPIDFILAFSNPDWSRKLMWWFLAFLFLSYVFRQLKEILLATNLWRNSILHFLLYLCTFEIAPLALLYEFFHRSV